MAGLIDNLVLEQYDSSTGEFLGCYKVMNNEDIQSESEDAEEILFALKSQSINSAIIINFMDMVNSEKLKLLEKRSDVNYDIEDQDHYTNNMLPFVQTDFLLEEVSNLKLETLQNNDVTIKQQVKKINKDRYSALAYGLWYIKNFLDGEVDYNPDNSVADFLIIN